MTVPCMRDDRPSVPAVQRAFIRRKFEAGARLFAPFRFARLFHDGDRLWVIGDMDEIWRRLTLGITVEKSLLDRGHWAGDLNRLVGLHQCRIAIRRLRKEIRHGVTL